MSTSPFDLETLQRWMQSQLMEADLAGGIAPVAIEDVITASPLQTSRQRLDVYAYAYQARLVECLREEFATLCQFLGQDVFDGLAVAYLQAHPSHSYTLADLGSRFPAFMQQAAAALTDEADEGSETAENGTQFLVELATLERLYAEVFDGPGIEGVSLITPEELKKISPDRWPDIRFETAPCLNLMEFAYPVHEFVTACRQGTEPPIPEPRPTRLAVTRRQYVVRRVPLTETQFRLLALLAKGRPLGEALETTAADGDDIDGLVKDVQQWFYEWTASGFFVGVRS